MAFESKYETIVDLYEQSVEKYATRDLFGSKRDGVWSWITYQRLKELVDAARAGLARIGVQRGDRVAMISNNCVNWAVASYATLGLGAVYVPMYESQLAKDWEFILKDCEAKVLIVSTEAIREKVRDFPSRIPSLQHIIAMAAPESDQESFEHLLAVGRATPTPSFRPTADDTAFLIYTSGTTGNPKGVILTHRNIATNVAAVHEVFDICQDDRTLSFLPWAHSFGMTCELQTVISLGGSMAINTVVEKLVAEMPEVRPTILVSVPRIFNRIYDGVQKQVTAKPAPIRSLVSAGLRAAGKRRDNHPLSFGERLALSLADKLVFSKIRQKFGGRLRYAVSGGAALSKDVGEFIDGLGITVYEGYGLTETSPIVSANNPGHRRMGSVGPTVPGVRVAIDREVTGDPLHGEIVVYGPNVMKGYFRRDEETAAVLLKDGGFRTGDMGYVDDDGFLFITGRIKEQYKLENGKYVVPVPIEEALKLSLFITNVFVHGANKPHNVALIVPDFDTLKGWAQSQGIDGADPEKLIRNDRVVARIREEIDAHSRDLKGYERIEKFALVSEDFTTDNGMLTPSLKLKRRAVLERYGDVVEGLYA